MSEQDGRSDILEDPVTNSWVYETAASEEEVQSPSILDVVKKPNLGVTTTSSSPPHGPFLDEAEILLLTAASVVGGHDDKTTAGGASIAPTTVPSSAARGQQDRVVALEKAQILHLTAASVVASPSSPATVTCKDVGSSAMDTTTTPSLAKKKLVVKPDNPFAAQERKGAAEETCSASLTPKNAFGTTDSGGDAPGVDSTTELDQFISDVVGSINQMGTMSTTQHDNQQRPRSSQQREPSRPGAFRVAGFAAADYEQQSVFDQEEEEDTSPQYHAPFTTSSSNENNNGLVSAYEVNDDDDHDEELAQHARPFGATQSRRSSGGILPSSQQLTLEQQKQQRQQCWCMALWLVGAITFVAFVVGAFLLPNSSSDGNRQDLSTIPSLFPSFAPSDGLLDTLLDVLPDSTLVTLQHDRFSPQSKAYDWLFRHPDLADLPVERQQQLFALATLFYATNGYSWHNNGGWLSYSVHECLWFSQGAFLDFKDENHTYVEYTFPNPCEWSASRHENHVAKSTSTLNHDGYFQHIWLYGNNLQGTIPPQISLLAPTLRSISFYNNPELGGSISSDIGLLTNLEAITFGGTQLSGTLPTQIGQISDSLTSFTVINTNVEGTLPTELGQLHRLQDLLLDQNYFTGTVPLELAQATNLKNVFLAENNINGTFPVHLTTLPLLEQLLLDQCFFTGPLPTEIGLLTSAFYLSLFYNEFSGTIPTEIGLMVNMHIIYFDENQLTGTLPTELGLLENLAMLEIWVNQLTGTMPVQLGACTHLETLGVDTNFLTGTIPTEVASLPELFWFETYSNLMTGSIPTEFGLAPRAGLRLNDNSYTGSIPEELGEELWYLQLENNPFLSGTIPPHLNFQASNYTDNSKNFHPPTFKIAGTGISGTIPETLCATEVLEFDCSSLLCGCDCSCNGSSVGG